MALNAALLSADIAARWERDPRARFTTPQHPKITDLQEASIKALTDAIAQAVIAHFIANGQINVTSVTGVYPGIGVSGPGTGTIL